MEEILIGLAANLLFKLFLEPALKPEKHAPPPQPQVIIQRVEPSLPVQRVIKAPLKPKLELPDYVLRIPEGHFVGVSAPSKNLQEARMSSINNAMEQILRAMGAT